MGALAVKKQKAKASTFAVVSKAKTKLKTKNKGKVVQFPISRIGKKKSRFLSQKARDELVVNSRDQARKLARSILRKWRSRLELEEVDSIVDLSLCEAAMRFDLSRGVSFITFLYYHLRGNLIRLVTDAANLNLLPLFDRELLDGAGDLSSNGALANAIEIAAALTGQEQVLPDEHLYKKEVSGLSKQACEKLDLLEQEVINRVFLNEEHLFDVAEKLGYSRCHISRVKRKALDTLQAELKPLLVEAKAAPVIRLSGKRRSVSRRGYHRREMLNNVVVSKKKNQTEEEFSIAL